jgi:myo-inositol 2-dehydrogenase/D-chiro-inositol 1-dehydrogenase
MSATSLGGGQKEEAGGDGVWTGRRAVRVAVVGVGRIGRFHASILRDLLGKDRVLVADADEARARQVAAELQVEVQGVSDAIDRADALVVAASTAAHPALVRRGLARRIPIFCEKPLAATLEESVELAREIDAANVPFQLGFQRRFDPGYELVRAKISAGEFGTLYGLRLIAHDSSPPQEGYVAASGGIFRDASTHDFDTIRWLTAREVLEVSAYGTVRAFPMFKRYDDFDVAVAVLILDDTTPAVVTNTRHHPIGYDVRVEIIGSRAALALGLHSRTPLQAVESDLSTGVSPWQTFLDRFALAYRRELERFLRLALGEAPSPCTAWDGVEALRIAEAAVRSARYRRPVPLSDIPVDAAASIRLHPTPQE